MQARYSAIGRLGLEGDWTRRYLRSVEAAVSLAEGSVERTLTIVLSCCAGGARCRERCP